jgi:hypothetical protein
MAGAVGVDVTDVPIAGRPGTISALGMAFWLVGPA